MEILLYIIGLFIVYIVWASWYRTNVIKKSFDLLKNTSNPVNIPIGYYEVIKYLNKQGAGMLNDPDTVSGRTFYWNDKMVILTAEGNLRTGNTIIQFS